MESVTTPFPKRLTKYERIQVIGMRSEQIARGAQIMVQREDADTPYEIAERELSSGVMPFVVVRRMPDGKAEYLRLSDGTQNKVYSYATPPIKRNANRPPSSVQG
jgi:DNA-directed RNA polymerase subunit K/omega